jgi:hypothetical protein
VSQKSVERDTISIVESGRCRFGRAAIDARLFLEETIGEWVNKTIGGQDLKTY